MPLAAASLIPKRPSSAPGLRAGLVGANLDGLAYLLLARFGADKAAPLGSPLAVDVGTLAVVDVANKLSQSGGVLRLTGNNGVSNDTRIAAGSWARVTGRALLFTLAQRSGRCQVWWSTTADDTGRRAHLDTQGNLVGVRSYSGGVFSTGNTDAITVGARYQVALVLCSSGTHFLVRGGAEYPTWKLLFPQAGKAGGQDTASPLYIGGGVVTQPSDIDLDDFRVLDLPAPWNSDYGIATSRLANPVGAATLYPQNADVVIESTLTYKTASTFSIYTRYQDDNNNWRISSNGSGNLLLQQVSGGVFTTRISGGAMVDGTQYRIVLIEDGNAYRLYLSDALVGAYTDAGSSLTTQQSLRIQSTGSGGIAELVAWPRYVSLPSGV